LGLELPKGFFLDSTGKIVRNDVKEEMFPEEEATATMEWRLGIDVKWHQEHGEEPFPF
jgi:hypothetical protein